ncbi:hypothetical protein IWW38_004568, partial [Coemansia aciculifera]
MFETYSRFLELALSQRSPTRTHLVLKRMLGEHIRLGKPTGVSFELFDRCVEALLTWILNGSGTNGLAFDSALDAVKCLDEISWRVRHRNCKAAALWTLASAVACDIRGDAANRTKALASLTLEASDEPLVLRVLRSPVISTQLLSSLHACVDGDLGMDNTLATAFYVSAMSNRQRQSIPEAISAAMLAHGSVALFTDSANSMLALVDLHLCRSDWQSAELALAQFSRLTAHARWPMGALAIAIRKLLGLERHGCAHRLLEISASRKNYEFGRAVGEQSALDSSDFKFTLLENEIDVALSTHRATVEAETWPASVLPRAAFFAPKLKTGFGDPGVADCIERYYAQVAQLFLPYSPTALLARRLIAEAGSWCYRLQSPVPVLNVTTLLSRNIRIGDNQGVQVPELLLEYARLLRSFSMIRLTDRLCNASSAGSKQYTCPSLLAPTDSVKQTAMLDDPLIGFEATRRTLLAEYLRQGLQPSPEVLAIFHSHLAATTSDRPGVCSLARRILPEIPPSLVNQRRYSKS